MSFVKPANSSARQMLHELGDFRNEPPTDFSLPEAQARLRPALEEVRGRMPFRVPLIIDGKRIDTVETLEDRDPSDTARLVAVSSLASVDQVDAAVAAARRAFAAWSATAATERCRILLRAAALLRERKQLLSAVAVYEAAKPGAQALADIDEAIDFVEYYVREMLENADLVHLQPYLEGEKNQYGYFPLGVVGVIGPWNFPLAIPVGMAAAALVAGNTVVMKPAEQTPLITQFWIEALEEAGLPAGAINHIPGRGETAGARLVSHPQVNMIVFTGSRDVGLMITRAASQVPPGQPFVKRIVTEMGGKNALIVDESAQIDRSVADALYSAFGFSGQKCSAGSRLIVHERLYDTYRQKLTAEAARIVCGPAEDPATLVCPVIDGEARAKICSFIELGKKEARTVFAGDVSRHEAKGHYVAPHIFEVDSPDHRLMQEEIFGPVLTMIRAKNFDEALAIANDTPYALTGGVHSQNREHLDRAIREFACGNLYLNRPIVGAVVERQPFGGYRLSGIGSKTGGPDYLKQFLVARTVTERTA